MIDFDTPKNAPDVRGTLEITKPAATTPPMPPIPPPAPYPTMGKYQREIKPGVWVDVYDVLKAFDVTNPATAHAVKKLLAAGKRGSKGIGTDLDESIESIKRAIDLECT